MTFKEENRVDGYVAHQLDSVEFINDQNQQLGWSANYRQLKPARFVGRLDLCNYGNTLIARESFNTPIALSNSPPPGKMALLICLKDCPAINVNGQAVSESSILLIEPEVENWAIIPESGTYYVAHFEVSEITACLEDLNASLKRRFNPSGASIYPCSPDGVENLRASLRDTLYGPKLCATAEREILSDFIYAFLNTIVADYPSSKGSEDLGKSRRKLALNIREYIEAHFQQAITLEDLSHAFNSSHRTIERAFRQTFGMTIREYIKVCRLNAAHCALISSSSGTTTVTEIAIQSGYSHLGRFSVDYKFLMKESPSTSLLKESRRG